MLANVHAEAASGGQTAAPDADANVDLHFTCFVQAPSPESRFKDSGKIEMRLVELDGRRGGPVDRGVCVDLLRVIIFWPNIWAISTYNSRMRLVTSKERWYPKCSQASN